MTSSVHPKTWWWFSLARSLSEFILSAAEGFWMKATHNLPFRAKREIFPGPRNRAEIKLNGYRKP